MSRFSGSRLPIFYPSQLARYRQCPEQYYHKHVARRKMSEPFSPALLRGNIAHSVLEHVFHEFQQQGTFPTDLCHRIESVLPRLQYPGTKAWRGEVETILAQVQFALQEFDGTATVLATEQTYEFAYRGDAACPPFALRVKVDRITCHPDKSLEHADYKTGRDIKVDMLQNVAARIVVRNTFGDLYPAIHSTSIFLAARATRTDDLTRQQVQEVWREIKQTVTAILSAGSWQPQRSPLCEWYPFYGNGCSLDPVDGDGDALAAWLDGVAV